MKKLFLSLIILSILLSSTNTFAYNTNNDDWWAPISDISIEIGIDSDYYPGCSSDYLNLAKQFQSSLASYKIGDAIKTWENMDPNRTCMGTSIDYPTSTLFGNYAPMGTPVMPEYVMMKKNYKNGILYIGRHCFLNCSPSDYYIGFIKAKKGLIYIYNTPLAPIGSKQHSAYKKAYNPETYIGNTDSYTAIYNDLLQSFKKGKFNNSNTNSVYTKFIRSIRS